MMRLILSFLSIMLFFSGCTPKAKPMTRCGYSPESEEITNIIISVSRELQEEHDLFLYDSRVIFDEKIKKIRIDYTSQQSVELCEAREILVDIVDKMNERLNGHATLRAAFSHRPSSYRDLEIHVTFESFFNKFVDPSYMAYIILENGWSFFYSSELNISYTDVWMQKVEPFYKTQQFVKFSREAEIPYTDSSEKEKDQKVLDEERLYLNQSVTNALFGS